MESTEEIPYYLDNGQVVLFDDQKRLILLGDDGYRFYLDESGEEIAVDISDEPCLNDIIGNSIRLDANNNIHYHDKKGNLVRKDENGRPYFIDDNGETIYYHTCPEIYIDGFGEPQKPFPKWVKALGVISIVIACVQGLMFFANQSEKNRIEQAVAEAQIKVEEEGLDADTLAAVERLNARRAKAGGALNAWTKPSFSQDLAAPLGISVGLDRDTAEAEIRGYFTDALNQGGLPLFNITKTEDGSTRFLATRDHMQDDSVKAEQLEAIFSDNILTRYGMRLKCYRVADPEQWLTELCP